jgi:hypothetical protein
MAEESTAFGLNDTAGIRNSHRGSSNGNSASARTLIEQAYLERGLVAAMDLLTYVGRAITPSHSFRRFNTRFFLGDGNDVHGEPVTSEELEDVGWHPVEHEAFASFRDVTRFMLARAIALRQGCASAEAPLFYWAKNARRIGICREAVVGAT